VSPFFYQPEPYGAEESDAHDALIAAGFSLYTRHNHVGPFAVCYRRAIRDDNYRTRTHRTFRALLRQAREDGKL
jgi:hypothetical protein